MPAYRKYLSLLALLVLMVPLAVRAQTVAAPQFVPQNFDAVVSINDANGMWNAYSQSPVRRQMDALLALPTIAGDPDYQQFLIDLEKAELELGFGLNPQDLLGKVLKGADLYMIPGADGAEPQVLVAARFNDAANAGKLNDYLVSKIKEQFGEEVPEGAIQSTKVGGNHVTSIPMFKLNMTPVGDVLLLSTSLPTIESALGGGSKIADAPGFMKTYTHVQMDGAQVMIFGKGKELMALITSFAPPEAKEALANMQMEMGDFSGTLLFQPDRTEVNTFAFVEDDMLQKLASIAKPSKLKALDFAGSDVLAGWAGNIFEGETVKAMINDRLMKAQESNPGIPTLDAIDAQVLEQMGFSLTGDLFPALGPEVGGFLNSFALSGFMPDVDLALIGQIRNGEKLTKVMTALEDKLITQLSQQQMGMDPNAPAVKVVEEVYKGVTIRALNATPPEAPSKMGFYHANVDGFAIVSISPDAIRNAIDTKKGEKSGLAGSAKWGRAGDYLPSEFNQLTIVNMQGLGSSLQAIAPMAMGMMQVGQEEMQVGFAALDLMKSFGTAYAATTLVDGGQKGKMVFLMPTQ